MLNRKLFAARTYYRVIGVIDLGDFDAVWLSSKTQLAINR
jgi:hypothetical protein